MSVDVNESDHSAPRGFSSYSSLRRDVDSTACCQVALDSLSCIVLVCAKKRNVTRETNRALALAISFHDKQSRGLFLFQKVFRVL